MLKLHPTTEVCCRCHASAWERIGSEARRERGKTRMLDVVECAFCGNRCSVRAAPHDGYEEPAAVTDPDEFRFQSGRFRGMTLREADSEPSGRRYLEVLRDTDEKMREVVTRYLANAAPSA